MPPLHILDLILKEKHNWCQEERLVFQLSLKSSLTPPDLFQALKLQFWPKLSITLRSLPDSQSHSKSLSELTLSSSRLAKLQQQAPRDSFQVQNFRFTKLWIWIGLQHGESDDERDGGDGDVYVEVNNSHDDENAQ